MNPLELAGQRVSVYRNLTAKGYSIKVGSRVVAVVPALVLEDVSFRCQPAGNRRARHERQRNVHAFADGVLVEVDRVWVPIEAKPVSYDPFRDHGFVLVDVSGRNPISSLARLYLTPVGTFGIPHDLEKAA